VNTETEFPPYCPFKAAARKIKVYSPEYMAVVVEANVGNLHTVLFKYVLTICERQIS
jgi:hypothetical protein